MQQIFQSLAEQARMNEAERAALDARAARVFDDVDFRASLGRDGFVRVPAAVGGELLLAARREINRQLGASSAGADAFKAKTLAGQPAVTNLFNRSMLPHLLHRLLWGGTGAGTDADAIPIMRIGQLALRFPGDMCSEGN